MDSATQPKPKPADTAFDPESYRMSLGDHLEELRWRLILGLVGFGLVAIVCFIFGERVMDIFIWPLVKSLIRHGLNPQVYTTRITDVFTVYVQISLITALAISSPWMLFQLWQFVRAGLYPTERRYVTKYMPFSIFLLIAGMLFMYFVVLPITLDFLFAFSINLPMTGPAPTVATGPATTQPVMTIPVLPGDPAAPLPNQMWVDSHQQRVKIFFDGAIRVIPFGTQSLISPMITLPDYIDMVLSLLLIFGLTFQLPLVMLALVKMGIIDVPTLRRFRRIAYFIIAIVCGMIIPDVVTGMIALMIPLIILYEVGILLAARGARKATAT